MCVLNGKVPTTGPARIIYENEIILKDNEKDLSHLFKSRRQNAARAVKIRGLLIDFHFRSRLFWSSSLFPFFPRLLQKIGDLQRWFLESSQIFGVFLLSMPRTKIAPRNPKQAGAGFRISYRPMPNGLIFYDSRAVRETSSRSSKNSKFFILNNLFLDLNYLNPFTFLFHMFIELFNLF